MPVNKFRFIENIFIASNEHAAEIIGLGGFKIKKIAKATNTFIQCPSPDDFPIFEVHGNRRIDVLFAKKWIQKYANHFDEMRNKKRQIQVDVDAGEIIDTIQFRKADVPYCIGRRGLKIKKIMNLSQVKVISPDTNKSSIFILAGMKQNIKMCTFWMKLTIFCANGNNYFSMDEIALICDCINGNLNNGIFLQSIQSIVSPYILLEKLKFIQVQNNFSQQLNMTYFQKFWYCWKCKKNCVRIAFPLCGHKISCDVCIISLYADIYLRCFCCHRKIDSFIIQHL